MKKIILLTAVFLFIASGFTLAQDSLVTAKVPVKQLLCRKWLSTSYSENGKKDGDFYVYIRFGDDGKYLYIEDDEPIQDESNAEKGVWELANDNTILFDKGTSDEEKMIIISIDDASLNLSFTQDNVLYNIVFAPGNLK